jgi:chemotaxis protein histidine kinase CheA/DNA-binding response OmpR family regulator
VNSQEFPHSQAAHSISVSLNDLTVRESFHQQVNLRLQKMETLLEQGEQPENIQQFQSYCLQLATWGKEAELPIWVELLETAAAAIAHSESSFQASATLIIQEVKQAAEKVLEGCIQDIHLSNGLKAIAAPSFPISSDPEQPDPSADDLVSLFDETFLEEFLSPTSLEINASELSALTPLSSEDGNRDLFGSDGLGEEETVSQNFDFLDLFETPVQDFVVQETTSDPSIVSPEDLADLFSLDPSSSSATVASPVDDLLKPLLDFEIFEATPLSIDVGIEFSPLSFLYPQFEDLDVFMEAPGVVGAGELSSAAVFEELEAIINAPAALSPTVSVLIAQSGYSELPVSPEQRLTPPSNQDARLTDLKWLAEGADRSIEDSSKVQAIDDRSLSSRTRSSKGKVFEQTMRVPVKQLDNLSNLIGELVVKRNRLEQDQERLRQFLDNLLNQVQGLSDVGGRMQELYERTLLEGALIASRNESRAFSDRSSFLDSEPTDPDNLIDHEDLDALEMDRFTGFHLLSQEMIELIVRVRESASDIQFLVDETDQVARTLRQVTTQLQEGMTQSRMVTFAQAADRLPRAIREVSFKLNKQAKLDIEGREVLIDKMILEHLYNPMTHLINNAITHGIESPQVREQQGKPPMGRVTVRAFLQGNQTVISFSDDGAGINSEQVKAKAIEKKLITAAEAQALSNQEVYDFLFHPGFSTKDKADDFSGRGVGLDVVSTSLNEIRGSISIDSIPGKGTTFIIRLPLTLSICKALCCLSDRARIAFPMDGVEEMKDYNPSEIQSNAEGLPCIPWRDTLLPFQPLGELLSYNRHISRRTVYGGKQEDDTISIIVLRGTGNWLAIQVDRVLGEQEIVIKQIEGPIPKPAGIAGATVLGDGSIMPIGDVLELIEIAQGRMRIDTSSNLWKRATPSTVEAAVKLEPTVLIVDDSITVRELLSLSFKKAGYRVEQARDGQEAWEKLRSGLPCDIVFCDIEMPRMNGLELLSNLQKEDALANIPVALLTSRGADRHRKVAAKLGASGYFTKPYTEKDLLDAAKRMMQGEVLLANSTKVATTPNPKTSTFFPQIPPNSLLTFQPPVLIVDDSITVREMLSATFTQAGYQVEQARDGQEAWEKLRSGLPCSLIFCDIEMPRINGLELLSRLQEDADLRSIPVAMITSRGAEKHRQIAAERGAKGYFTKPYIEEVLLDAAQRLLKGEVLLENTNSKA